MRGYRVPRKAGWDCHGLPVELEVERRLGIDGKEQIEEYGVAEFNKLCRESVSPYLEDWDRFTERIGFWIDLDDAYYTFTNDYIESVWWLLRQIWDKGCSTRASRSCPTARAAARPSQPRGGAGLQGRHRPSVYVRFPPPRRPVATIAPVERRAAPDAAACAPGGRPSRWPSGRPRRGRSISNVAAAVHPDVTYALAESRGERFVLARDLVEKVLGRRPSSSASSPAPSCSASTTSRPTASWRPTSAPGSWSAPTTSRPPTAPASCTSRRPSAKTTCASAATTTCRWSTGRYRGALRRRGHAVGRRVRQRRRPGHHRRPQRSAACCSAAEPYEHSYPFCWRCDTPLLYYAKPTWYIRTTAIKDELLAANEDVDWHPEHIKHGRFGEWLENNVDWALSRDRYWGTPLPVWRCEKGHTHCVGSVAELRELADRDLPDDLDLHRPYVDDVTFCLPECGGDMHARARGHRRLVRLRLHAVRAVALPVRERGRSSRALPGRLHLRGHRPDARLVLQPAGGGHARLRRAARTRTCSAWATSSTPTARR
jgi:isoleucyl-tRNA synthetase